MGRGGSKLTESNNKPKGGGGGGNGKGLFKKLKLLTLAQQTLKQPS